MHTFYTHVLCVICTEVKDITFLELKKQSEATCAGTPSYHRASSEFDVRSRNDTKVGNSQSFYGLYIL